MACVACARTGGAIDMAAVVGRWRENASMLLANPTAAGPAALARLADALLRAGRSAAAHVWCAVASAVDTAKHMGTLGR